MKYHLSFPLLAFFIWVGVFPSLAQQQPQQKELSSWYLGQIFSLADANADQRLSTFELENMGKLLIYYLDESHFKRTDTDRDGMLNEQELSYRMGQAIVYRLEADEKELKKLEQSYPYFSEAKINYLKRQPELAAKLMENLVWSRTNPDMVDKLISDRSWLNQNSHVAQALNKNLIWLIENPETAIKFYRLREAKMQGGYLKIWREEHKNYLDKHPGITENPIPLDFPYWPEEKSQISTENYHTSSSSFIWDPNQAAIDSLVQLNRRQKEQYEKRIASLNKEIQRRDSISQKINETPLNPLFTGDDVAKLKEANEALRKRLNEIKIEHKLAMIEEDSLLATTIRQKNKIAFLEQSLELAKQRERPAKNDQTGEIPQIKPIAPRNLIPVVDTDCMDENNRLFAEVDKLALDNAALSSRINQLQQKHQEQLLAFGNLSQSVIEGEKKRAGLQFKLDSLLTSSQHKKEVSKTQNDSLFIENKLLKRQIELILTENQKLAQAYDQHVLNNESLQDSLVRLSLNSKKTDQQHLQTERQLKTNLSQVEQELAILRIQNQQLLNQGIKERDSLKIVLAANQIEFELLDRQYKEYWMKSEQAKKVVIDKQDMLEQWQKDQEKYRARIEELENHNRKLDEEMKATLEVAHAKEEILEKRLKSSLKENQTLRYQNRKLKARKKYPTDDVQMQLENLAFELEEARKRIKHLEETNDALLNQLEANTQYLTEHVQEKNRLRSELGKQMAESALQRSQNDTIRMKLQKHSQTHLQDSVQTYKSRLKAMEYRLLIQRGLSEKAIGGMEQSIDSLNNEIALLREQKQRIITQNKVDMERILRSGNKEKELHSLEINLVEREYKIKQREEAIQEKLEILAQKERKYLQLKEWEKNLYLLERRLKNQAAELEKNQKD